MSYNTKNYAAHGGNEWVVGGKLTILEGATVTGIATTAAPASADALGGVIADAAGEGDTIEIKIGDDGKLYAPALTAATADTIGGVYLVENMPESQAEDITELVDDFNLLLLKLKAAGIMAPDSLTD